MYSSIQFSDLTQWTKGEWKGDHKANPLVTEISSDSRTVKAGDIFVALRGEKFDGHLYLAEAVNKGAAAIISEEPFATSVPVLVVKNTLLALADIGKAMRDRFEGPVFAITGSAGKSSTKEALAVALGKGTLASPASYNNLLGVAKTLFLLEDRTEKLVLEMGMNDFGEIRQMCEHYSPQAGLITNIGDAHIGRLGGKDGIYRAKKELFDYLAGRSDNLGIALNVDDDLVVKAYESAFGPKAKSMKTITYSTYSTAKADVRVIDCGMDQKTGYLKMTLEVLGKKIALHLPIYGIHFAQNIAAASAAAILLGVKPEQLEQTLPQFQPASHRGHIHHMTNDRILIDESYNSNPSALTASLKSAANFAKTRSRLFVLGEMRELENFSADLHRELGQRFVSLFKEVPFTLIAVGNEMKGFVAAVNEGKPSQGKLEWCASGTEATALALAAYQNGVVCLVKGSRGIKLEQVVESLKKS